MTTKTKQKDKSISPVLLAEVKKIEKRIDKSGLQKDHICDKIDIAQQTLSNFLAGKKDYVTKSIIKRLNDYLDTVVS